MSSELRRRIPWNRTAESVAEEETSFIEAEEAEATAFETFEFAEGAGLALDETGFGAPLGLLVGALAAIGYGGYKIYEKIHNKHPQIPKHVIENHISEQKVDEIDIIPLEHQHEDSDFVGLEEQHSGFVPPPFKYLGPGNSLNRGPAYNYIDDDARIHDQEYSQAYSEQDIHNSDKNFINKAIDHVVEGISGKGSISDTVGSVLGAVGIGSKHFVEKSIGKVIYPSISGKIWHLLIEKQPLLHQLINV